MPRPTKRTPTAQQRIVQALRLGATYRRAAEAGGIGHTVLYEWLAANPDFADTCRKAEAERANQALRVIQRAGKENWQAAAWYLERRYPQEYGRTIQEQHGEQRLTVVYEHDWRRVRLGAGEVVALPAASDESEAAS